MNRIEKIVSAGLSVVLVFACAGFADAQTTRTRTPRTPPATKSTPRTPKAVAPKPTAPPRQPAPKPEPKTDDAPAPKTAEPPAPPPAAKAEPAKPGASATTTPEDLGPKTETDPAVLTALQTPRKTPRDYLQAIMWLIDLGRPELAKPIMADLAKLQITDEQRIELVAEFGSSSMLKLARTKDLAPAGIAFSHACMAAASTVSNNPQRMTT